MTIKYRAGYKYQLAEDYVIELQHFETPYGIADLEFIHLTAPRATGQVLTICEGYAWDGPSGPTIDTKDFMRGSLVHDALYQVLRETGNAEHKQRRMLADKELRRICLEDRMSKLRAAYVYLAVRIFGDPSSRGLAKTFEAP